MIRPKEKCDPDIYKLVSGQESTSHRVTNAFHRGFNKLTRNGATGDLVFKNKTLTWCRLDLPYPKAAGPGGIFRIIGYVLPVDETHCTVFFWRLRKIEGLARQSWRFLYRALLEERHWTVLEQDREMLSAMPDDARRREMLYQHDVGVSRVRLVLKQMARDQIEAEDRAAMQAAG